MSSNPQYNLNVNVTASTTNTNSSCRIGDIEHLSQLSSDLSVLYMNDDYADVTLIVEGQSIYAHKVILAARSEYFRALFYGGMKESSQSEIVLNGAPLNAFKILLKYIYSGHLFWRTLSEELILETLGLAHEYGFQELETAISNILRTILCLKNACAILDTARLFCLEHLTQVCFTFFDHHASEILKHDTFTTLSQSSLIELLNRDSFFAPEVEIYMGVSAWCLANEDRDGLVMKSVRLPLISVTELLDVVRPSGLVDSDTILDAIAERTHSPISSLRCRGQLLVDENVARKELGSIVEDGELGDTLLDENHKDYDVEKGYTRHAISSNENQCIVVKLGKPSIINHIKLLLYDKDPRSYSYYIEVSMQKKEWARVIDYSHYACRSWQYLYFETRVVRYIKIVGTNNTMNKVFHLVSLQAYYKEKIPLMLRDVIYPKYNVATLDKSAVVLEGVCRFRNALLNGDTKHYDLDSGYTCHQIGSGSILIQLGQPYIIGTLRLLLWDCDDRYYSYYIETSVNNIDFDIICDRTRDSCRSWQTVSFAPRPVSFIRIVGTRNTANEVFHCVHFECPSCDETDLQQWDTTTVKLKAEQSNSHNYNSTSTVATKKLSVESTTSHSTSSLSSVSSNNHPSASGIQLPVFLGNHQIQPTETATEAEELPFAGTSK